MSTVEQLICRNSATLGLRHSRDRLIFLLQADTSSLQSRDQPDIPCAVVHTYYV